METPFLSESWVWEHPFDGVAFMFVVKAQTFIISSIHFARLRIIHPFEPSRRSSRQRHLQLYTF